VLEKLNCCVGQCQRQHQGSLLWLRVGDASQRVPSSPANECPSPSKAEGESKGLAGYFAKQLSEVMDKLPSEFPATLNLQRQGTFALGYFHQMNRRKTTENDATAAAAPKE